MLLLKELPLRYLIQKVYHTSHYNKIDNAIELNRKLRVPIKHQSLIENKI